MKSFRHVILVILICLVIGIQGTFANDTHANGAQHLKIPHWKIFLFKFGGTAQLLNQDKFDEFTNAIRRAINELNGNLVYKNEDFRYLSEFNYINYKEFGRKFTFYNGKVREKFYKNFKALEIHTGTVGSKIVDNEKIIYVRDDIYLINSIAKTQDPIELVHNITAEEYNCLKNIQQALMCYALAMDAKRIEKDKAIIIEFLSDSFNMMSNIDPSKQPFAKSLKDIIINELKALNPSSHFSGSN